MKPCCLYIVALLIIGSFASAQSIPAPSIIKVSVDVNTGFSTIEWQKTNDPLVIFYRVALTLRTQGGTSISHIIIPGSQVSANIANPSYTYKIDDAKKSSIGLSVRAYYDEDHSSSIAQTDSTVFLTAIFDSCQSTIQLNWNDYNSWRGNIQRYTVYQSVDGGSWKAVQNFAEGTQAHSISNVSPNRYYRFFVATIRNNSANDSSASNSIALNSNMSIVPAYMVMNFASYHPEGQEIGLSIDPVSEMKSYNLLRANNSGGPFDSIARFDNSLKERTYVDPTSFSQGPFYYRLVALNHCMQPAKTSQNTASTILLSARQENQQIELNWNTYETFAGATLPYIIERKSTTSGYQTITETTSTSYIDTDFINATNNDFSSDICYRITAVEGNGNPAGGSHKSISNEACIRLNPNVRFDYDAFIPDDANGNHRFGPEFDFAPVDFRFRIFNRAGVLVFESTQSQNAYWYGKHNNSNVPQGAYMYVLDYTGADGTSQQKTGTVTVVHTP